MTERHRFWRSDPTAIEGTVYFVQYARAFAVLGVLYYHLSPALAERSTDPDPIVAMVGAAGVDLFFVISGFIISVVAPRTPRSNADRFLLARFWRVAPLYWLVTIVLFLTLIIEPGLSRSSSADWGQLVHSLLFIPEESARPPFPIPVPILIVGWTLNYEMFFYAVVAVSIGLFGRRGPSMAALLLVAFVALGLAIGPENGHLRFYSDPILLEFAMGVLCHYVYVRTDRTAHTRLGFALLLVGIAILALQFEAPEDELRALRWGVPSSMMLLGGLYSVRYRNEALKRIGDWSYAIYLTHFPLVSLMARLGTDDVPGWAYYVGTTALVLFVGWVVHRAVERPLANLRPAFRRSEAAASA